MIATKQKELKLVSGAFYIPKDNSKPRGDDAHFICEERETLGVADGVGGWSKWGIDAGIYARELMENCSVSALLSPADLVVDPKKVLIEAHSNTKAEASSTACIIALQHNHLCAANLGDSGFLLLREGKIIYKSPIQQHEFNHPYQLGNGKHCDSPRKAMEIKVAVEAGDIIVVGTDGLLDNMFPHAIEEIVRNEQGNGPEHLARHIAANALYNSLDRYSETPFSEAAKQAGHEHQGGKTDDITVVVACVRPYES